VRRTVPQICRSTGPWLACGLVGVSLGLHSQPSDPHNAPYATCHGQIGLRWCPSPHGQPWHLVGAREAERTGARAGICCRPGEVGDGGPAQAPTQQPALRARLPHAAPGAQGSPLCELVGAWSMPRGHSAGGVLPARHTAPLLGGCSGSNGSEHGSAACLRPAAHTIAWQRRLWVHVHLRSTPLLSAVLSWQQQTCKSLGVMPVVRSMHCCMAGQHTAAWQVDVPVHGRPT